MKRATSDEIFIRGLEDPEEAYECVELHKRAQGYSDYRACYPAQLYITAGKTGGSVSLALGEGRIVGFVLVLPAWEDEKKFRYVQILAVDREYRDRSIGFRLLLSQREEALKLGIDELRWTFDPLEGRNSNLYIRKLAAVTRTYLENLYGYSIVEGLEPYQAAIANRFMVEWHIKSERVKRAIEGRREELALESLLDTGEASLVNEVEYRDGIERIKDIDISKENKFIIVQIPDYIIGIRDKDIEVAKGWNEGVGFLFKHYFRKGYILTDYVSIYDERVGKRRNYDILRKSDGETEVNF